MGGRDSIRRAKLISEPWASVDALANHLGGANACIYRWIENRWLPEGTMGRLCKVKLTEPDRWVCGVAADEPESRKDKWNRSR